MKKYIYFFFIIFISFSTIGFTGVKFGGNNNNTSGVNTIAVLLADTTLGSSNQVALKKADRDSTLSFMQNSGYAYDVIYRDTNQTTVPSLSGYKTLLLVETSFITASNLKPTWRDSIKSFLASGSVDDQKSLIIFGGDFGYNYSRSTAPDRDTILCSSYMKFFYRGDNGAVDTEDKITGVNINIAQSDSLIRETPGGFTGWNFYPDYVQSLAEGIILYSHEGRGITDSVAAVGVDGVTYNTAAVFVDPRYVAPISDGSGGNAHLFQGIFDFIINAGGGVPVELTSFSASVSNQAVTLNWATATETNNNGFSIEKKLQSGEFAAVGFIYGKGTTTEKQSYTFVDQNVETGKYNYRLKQIDFDGSFEYSNEIEVEVTSPIEYQLAQNYPNPFNPSTLIKYSVPVDAFVKISVHNAIGQKVAELVNQKVNAGNHEANFNASNLSSGVYYYRIEAGDFVSVKKMLLLK